jgi:hypothetical protein
VKKPIYSKLKEVQISNFVADEPDNIQDSLQDKPTFLSRDASPYSKEFKVRSEEAKFVSKWAKNPTSNYEDATQFDVL